MTLNNGIILDTLKCLKNVSIITFKSLQNLIVKVKAVATGTPSKFINNQSAGSSQQPVYISNGNVLPTNAPLKVGDFITSGNKMYYSILSGDRIGGNVYIENNNKKYEFMNGLNATKNIYYTQTYNGQYDSTHTIQKNLCSGDGGYPTKIIYVTYPPIDGIMETLGKKTNTNSAIYYVVNQTSQEIKTKRVANDGCVRFGKTGDVIKPNSATKFYWNGTDLYIQTS